MGNHAAAVAVCDDVLSRFGDARESALRERVVGALVNKGAALDQMGDSAAAISTLERLPDLLNDDSAAFKSLLVRGRVHLANMLLDFQEEFTRAETLISRFYHLANL